MVVLFKELLDADPYGMHPETNGASGCMVGFSQNVNRRHFTGLGSR